MTEGDELELALDESLRSYGEAGRGLEEIILRGVAQHARDARRRVRTWAIGLPLAACIVLALVLPRIWHRTADSIDLTQEVRKLERVPVEMDAHAKEMRTTAQTRPVKQHRARVQPGVDRPRRDVFPSPASLTPQEEALVQIVAHTPEDERAELVASQWKHDEPLHIAAIQIPPIQPLPGSDEEPNQ